ncbi:tRNA (adenosine(37)-N6)-threonylcarbamoyltransferase complex transferase subunit TsaD [Geothermobacter hydrogeniphilus]|uniref:tRNA N6-adenosine threonylcarbamoyltransferase n=1 Tax=Geothermobacter hydrogeniphilus TaxID=1969733 RepID=A0A2K2H9J1_9BACT|nr:tRNA (adenosine(37)-N6)-threonylcarbamoyltransferase complex transferase subunit TsaD [Geothermobacter hydrogeniphilus]PNU19900.1 tRNA (adenosine(37)-N6)-threonylcarbamoyltransferase complex transferase subunit TsaD [Geothermobacter hydrogeniphilus]
MLLLCIESSCDETAAAVVRDGREPLSSVIATQIDVHARYGGVVPEIASRQHLEAISPVIDQALEEAGCRLDNIEGLVVTRGPGLVGALLIGVSVAKALAWSRQLPLIGVHHIEGHILSPLLEREIAFPYLALAVSGGHTHLYRVDGIGRYKILGRTLDDAAGEAFDKVAKLLGLGYPGGAVIDRLAGEGDPQAIRFPRPMLNRDNLDFSFSGIKTSVMNHVRSAGDLSERQVRDVAAGFQAAVVEVLTAKTLRAAEEENLERIVVAGGVACNSGLRHRFAAESGARGMKVDFPSPALCGDNAAMLGVAGDYYLRNGARASLDLNAVPVWPLDQAAPLMA